MEYKTISKYETLSGHFERKIEQHQLMHPKAYDAAMEHIEKQFVADHPDSKFNPKQHLEQYKDQFVDHVLDTYTVKAKEFFHHPDIEKADLDRLVQVYTDQTRDGLHDLLRKNKYDIDLKKEFSEYTTATLHVLNNKLASVYQKWSVTILSRKLLTNTNWPKTPNGTCIKNVLIRLKPFNITNNNRPVKNLKVR